MPETMSRAAAETLVAAALAAAGANPDMARRTATALVDGELIGQAGHGLSRVAQYVAFLRNGRADGAALPTLTAHRPGAALIDAGNGLAYPALALAEAEGAARARANGVAFIGITNSHHSGAMGLPVNRLARLGLVALAFTNSPAAMPVAGGRRPLLGTNPVAAGFPRASPNPPLVADLALSTVARGTINGYAQRGQPIPEGWAVDAQGLPTTDAKVALTGALVALGGTKGAALALVVELLCVALTGAAFGFEADGFFTEAGNQPRLGQALLVIDPGAMAGQAVFLARIEALIAAMLEDDGVRIPGQRHAAAPDEIALSDAMAHTLRDLART